ncbi:MAG: response regulator [Thiohalomonadales bacterium]
MSVSKFDILVIDDDEVDVMNIRRAFKKNNIINRLHVAHNGVEALAMLQGVGAKILNPLPKIILLDIDMPKMNGFEFLEKIRTNENLRTLNVFILTTSNHDQDYVNAHKYDIAGYIVKPVVIQDFMASVASLNLCWQFGELQI